jgi:hypothetical protein
MFVLIKEPVSLSDVRSDFSQDVISLSNVPFLCLMNKNTRMFHNRQSRDNYYYHYHHRPVLCGCRQTQ